MAKSPAQSNRFAQVSALMALVLAVAVMYGWLVKIDWLIQLHPTLVPMQFNTALGLALAALALTSYYRAKIPLALAFAVAVLGLSSFTLLEYVFNADFGIDDFFIQPHILTHSPHPGRMALNTALSYFIAGLAIALLIAVKTLQVRILVVSALSATLLGLAIISLFGYATGLSPAVGWGAQLSRMAPHTATGFCLLAASLLFFVSTQKSVNDFFHKWLLAVTIPAALTFMLCLQFAVNREKQQQLNRQVTQQAMQLAEQIESDWQRLGQALERMAARWLVDSGTSEAIQRRDAEFLLADFAYLKNIRWLDTAYQPHWFEGEENSRSVDTVLMQSVQAFIEQNAAQTGSSVVRYSEPRWVEDALQIFARYPIRDAQQNFGWLLVDLLPQRYFAKFESTFKPMGLKLALRSESGALFYESPLENHASELLFSSSQPVNVDALEWRLTLSATPRYYELNKTPLLTVVMVILALLLFLLLYLVVLFSKARDQRATIDRLFLRQNSAFNAMLDGLVIIDRHGIIQDVNAALCNMFGYSRSDLLGNNVKMLMPAAIALEHDSSLSDFQSTRVARVLGQRRDFLAQTASGEKLPIAIQVTNYVVKGEEYFCGVLHDQRKLLESEERYKLVLEGSGVGIWDWLNVAEKEQFWSEKYYRLLGYQFGEIPASRAAFMELLHPKDQQRLIAHSQQHLENAESYDIDVRLRCKNKTYRWFRITGKASRDEFGRARRMVGSIEDIQKRKDLEIEQKRLVSILNHSPDYIVQFAEDLNLIFANRAMRELCEIDELGSSKMQSWYSAEQWQKIEQDIIPQCLENDLWMGEILLLGADGNPIPCLLAMMAHRDEDQQLLYFSAVFRDITQLKNQEEALRRTNKELESFAHIASHDLKEPVRSLQTFSEYLVIDLEKGREDRIERDLHFIRRACQRMNQQIEDMLKVSRIGSQALKMEILDLRVILEEICGQLSTRIGETQATIQLPQSIPPVYGDRGALVHIFSNLFTNALKFHKAGESPDIVVDVLPASGKFVEVVVADRGIGLPADRLQEIFVIYKRLHRAEEYPGTGIGLTVVEKAVRRMGGEITVESELGRGTKFIVKLQGGKFV